MYLSEIIEKIYWNELEKEGITKDCLDIVMLDIEFSPVTPFENASPCEVIETRDNKYIVFTELGPKTVTPDVLKVMRYRYLQFDFGRTQRREHINNMFK